MGSSQSRHAYAFYLQLSRPDPPYGGGFRQLARNNEDTRAEPWKEAGPRRNPWTMRRGAVLVRAFPWQGSRQKDRQRQQVRNLSFLGARSQERAPPLSRLPVSFWQRCVCAQFDTFAYIPC